MKTYRILCSRSLAAALSALLLAVVPGYAQAPREQQLFDRGWRFQFGGRQPGQSPALADKGWRRRAHSHASSVQALPPGADGMNVAIEDLIFDCAALNFKTRPCSSGDAENGPAPVPADQR